MTLRSELGIIGEDMAVNHLKNNGYIIIGRNFRKPWGEIDIIAKDPIGTLVFFEIKTIRQSGNLPNGESGISPEEQVTKAKLKKLIKTCSLYAGERQDLIGEHGWQIDLLAILIFDKGFDIKHYSNIVA